MKNIIYKKYYILHHTLKQIMPYMAFPKIWLLYIFLIPIIVPIFFFSEILPSENITVPYLIFFLSGYLSFSISFSAFKFSIRSLFIYRKRIERLLINPIKIFNQNYSLNFLFFFFNLILLIFFIFYYNFNINLNFYNSLLTIICILNAYYFGKFLTLSFAFGNILFRDSKFLGRNLSGFFFVFSPIGYQYPSEANRLIEIFFTINPISQSVIGIRKHLLNIETSLVDLNILYFLIFFTLYHILNSKLKKIIYEACVLSK